MKEILGNIVYNKKFAVFSLLLFIAAAAYGISQTITGDPRFDDGNLSGEEANIFEMVLFTFVPFSVLAVMYSAINHARSLGRKGWVITMFLVWPSVYVYVFKYVGKVPDDSNSANK